MRRHLACLSIPGIPSCLRSISTSPFRRVRLPKNSIVERLEFRLCILEYRTSHTSLGLRRSAPFQISPIALHARLTLRQGFDGAVHMSEETRQARQAVPRSIFYTVVTNGILAYGMVICILFTMGSVEEAQQQSFPIIQICQQATGSLKAATAMVCGLLVISLSVTLASIASASRLTWAWARDGALPRWFAYVGSLSASHSHSTG